MIKRSAAFIFAILSSGTTSFGTDCRDEVTINTYELGAPTSNPLVPIHPLNASIPIKKAGTLFDLLPHDIWQEVVSWLEHPDYLFFKCCAKDAPSILAKSQERGRGLAALICAYSKEKKIKVLTNADSYFDDPKYYTMNHFTSWIRKGHISLRLDECFSHRYLQSYPYYRGREGFLYTPYRPFIRFALEQDVSVWVNANLRDQCGSINGSLGNSPLHSVMRLKCDDLLKSFLRRPDLVAHCMTNKTIKGFSGNTPLHSLAKHGTLPMLKLFLCKTDLINQCLLPENIKGEKGNSPLHLLVIYASVEMLDTFLTYPQYVEPCLSPQNIRGESGNTPLHLLAKRNHKPLLQTFIKHPAYEKLCLAPENIKGEKGKTPAELACLY